MVDRNSSYNIMFFSQIFGVSIDGSGEPLSKNILNRDLSISEGMLRYRVNSFVPNKIVLDSLLV